MRSVTLAFFCFTLLVFGFYFGVENKISGRTAVIKKLEQDAAKPLIFEENQSYLETDEVKKFSKNNLNNLECQNHARRPIAIMLAGDDEARPLSGIGAADLVIEMPVVTGSITRMMALFVCEDLKEIGSVRSLRHDFIPLAVGFDAIAAHWGGSHFALEDLDKRPIDNLDAMINYYDSFYRKKWIPAPHNGFTSMERMINASSKLGYRLTSEFEGYRFLENPKFEISPLRKGFEGQANPKSQTADLKILKISYKYPYNVEYIYSNESNSYLRWRGGEKEVDALAGKQVEVKNVAVMRTQSRQIGEGYNDVDVIGSGDAAVYRNGEEVKGAWRKRNDTDVLRFYDEFGDEIKFVAGKIWINIIETDTIIEYQ